MGIIIDRANLEFEEVNRAIEHNTGQPISPANRASSWHMTDEDGHPLLSMYETGQSPRLIVRWRKE
jgi:hypothetical protein